MYKGKNLILQRLTAAFPLKSMFVTVSAVFRP